VITEYVRKKSDKKPGGQIGHEGSTLEFVEDPDEIEYHSVEVCKNCGASLEDVEPIDHECRQETDIPPPQPKVTEHQAEIKECPECGFLNKADFPSHVTQPTQYGVHVKAMASYFSQYQLIPYQRLQEIFYDCYSLSLSKGTLVNTNNTYYQKLEGPEMQIKNNLINSSHCHFDESGIRAKGKLNWLHVASTETLTHYAIHEKRGQKAMDDIGILPEFKGNAVHDHWKAYFNYKDCKHSLCNSHHLRELTYVEEQYKQKWARKMKDCLLEIKDKVDQLKEEGITELSPGQIKKFERKYQRILREGLKEIPKQDPPPKGKRGRPKQHKSKNLCDRLRNYRGQVLLFMYDFTVPFDNNQGERDIRMCKVKQKISGCFRSHKGGKTFCRIRGYISTARKNGVNAMDALVDAFNGKAFIPNS